MKGTYPVTSAFFVPLYLYFYLCVDMIDGEQWLSCDHKVTFRIGAMGLAG